MRKTFVLTALGPDRTGLVESLAAAIATAGGNWEDSRMARLAGQFAGILQVSIEPDRTDELVAALRALDQVGLQVTVAAADDAASAVPDGTRVHLELTGTDRPGIVRDVSRILAGLGVNVEQIESGVASAPMSGEAMFVANARLWVPSQLGLSDLRAQLEALASELMVDLAPA
ncbi:MAG: ACT domain-containing protein [Myxococcales bacterium]|nr:ACT domain-containing protein [Myxococcales bacterium]